MVAYWPHWLAAWCAAVSLVWCHAVWPAAAQATAGQALGMSRQVEVSTAPGLTRALRDPNVWDITITADIDMASELASWAALPASILLEHNLTFHGPPGQYPALNLRYWRLNGTAGRGFRLAPGVVVSFKHLVLMESLNFAPGFVVGCSGPSSWIVMHDCIFHAYTGFDMAQGLAVLMAVPSVPQEPPGSRAGLVLPAGYCRTGPSPAMCWDHAYVLLSHMPEYTNVLGTDKNATSCVNMVTNLFAVREEIMPAQCQAQYNAGNTSCVWDRVAYLMSRVPPGSLWPQPPASPDRLTRIMSSYDSTLAEYRQAARDRPGGQGDQQVTSFFPTPGVYVVVGSVVGLASLAAAGFAAVTWHRTTSTNPGQAEGGKGGEGGGGGGDARHSAAVDMEDQQPWEQHAGHKLHDTVPAADQQYSTGGESSTLYSTATSTAAELAVRMLAGLTPGADSMQGYEVGEGAVSLEGGGADGAGGGGGGGGHHLAVPHRMKTELFTLTEMVTPATPLDNLLATNLTVGTDVVLGQKIGEGAMGCVYRATYQGRAVAVKLLHPGTDAKTFLSEMSVLGRTRHPNVVQLLGTCTADEQLGLVEELCDTSLEELMFPDTRLSHDPSVHPLHISSTTANNNNNTTALPSSPQPDNTLLPLPLVLHIAMEVATGLAYLHPTIIHRDLKPGNVLLNIHPDYLRTHQQQDQEGQGVLSVADLVQQQDYTALQAKLTDFGVARIFDSLVLITQRRLQGTPAYMAPECFTSAITLSHKCDIYAFGILLWELVHGMRAWSGFPQPRMLFAVVVSRLRPAITKDTRRCPPALHSLIERCWLTDPDKRPPAIEIVRELAVIQRLLRLV